MYELRIVALNLVTKIPGHTLIQYFHEEYLSCKLEVNLQLTFLSTLLVELKIFYPVPSAVTLIYVDT